VPSDTQIGRYPTMGDWSTGGDKTELSQYADYLLNESLDQVPPTILFEELPGSVILESSVKGMDRIAVVADITDQTGLGQVPTIGTLDSVAVFYTETAQWQDSMFVVPAEQVEAAVRVDMANISGTRLWLADIPDTVYYFIQADDGTYQSRAPFTPATMDTAVIVFAPPSSEEVSWAKTIPQEADTLSVFAPDGTILEVPPGALASGSTVALSVPDETTFQAPTANTTDPPYATNGPLTPTGLYRRVSFPDKDEDDFSKPVRLSFHYTAQQVSQNQNLLRIYRWSETTQRWSRSGGRIGTAAGIVRAEITQAGIYGLFVDPDVSGAMESVIDDVHFDPNPFSPNNDGLYDDLSIQFSLNTNALARIEIYDINGQLIKILADDERFARGGHNVIWDGRDLDGETVPVGFYIVFLFVKSEREELPLAKLSRAVAVIR